MLAAIRKAILTGKHKKIESLMEEALDSGCRPSELLDEMCGAMDELGERFQKNEVYVPELLIAAKTMQKGVGVLKPRMQTGTAEPRGKYIIGTVQGDLHDIGKNLVAMIIETAGFEVIDLGVDVSPQRYVETVRANPDCRVIGLSALLTTTMPAMGETVRALKEAGLDKQVKIMVGGAPITAEFAAEIGADAYTPDAAAAAVKAKELSAL